MRFDQSQHMKLGQHMKLAPRMIQSMEILQLALPALEERIEQELESNIALETFEPGDDREEAEERRAEADAEAREAEKPMQVDEKHGEEDFARLDNFETEHAEAIEDEYASPSNGLPSRFEEHGSFSRTRMAGERDAKMDAMANTAARGESLVEQLLEQWALSDVGDELREAGKLLISHVDEDGYIRTDLTTIADTAPTGPDGYRPTAELLTRALLAVQMFLEPPGVGARDVRECLLLQVDAIEEMEPASAQALSVVRTLIDKHLDDLIHNRIPKIAAKTGLSLDEIKAAIEQMRRLSLKPARQLIRESEPSLVPDAIVEYDDDQDRYLAYLTDGRLPNLRLNREYARLAADRALPKGDREFIRTNITNAQWLIEAVEQRRQTLLRVIGVVLDAQRDFFDLGPQAIRPLPMTQVADQLGIHVATVSRAVAGKYLQTPRGIFPLRKFFTGGTQTESGEDVSWEAIKAAMREVVDSEDRSRPLSDEAIAAELKKRGLDIARRTVAKYRDQLEIPPARLRKQF
ncbi:MAG: RNA polymerase factor sigma-54 [Phycisphaerales bacterium]|nr:RNA polymerase factor sigma-54 [Phycisphaerales bacterium]